MNATVPQNSTTAILSLVFGIASWLVLPVIGAVLAVICGHLARADIRRAPAGALQGDGMAIAGLILGYLHLLLVVAIVLFIFVFLGGLAFFATHLQ